MRIVKKVLIRIFIKRFWLILGVIGLMVLGIGFQLLTPWPFKLLIDNVLGGELLDAATISGKLLSFFKTPESMGAFVVFLYLSSSVLSSVFEFARSDVSAQTIKYLIFDFSEKAFNNLEVSDYGFFRNKDIGDYIYRISYDVSALGSFLEDGIFPVISSCMYIVVATIVLWSIDPNLTILSLTVIPLLVTELIILNRLIEKTGKKSELSNSALYSFVQQSLTQLRIIQAFSREQKSLSSYNKKISVSLEFDYKMFRLNFILTLTTGIIIAGCYSLIMGIGIKSIFSGQLTGGLLIVFLYYLDNLTGPIISIIYAATSIKQSWIKISRLGEFFNTRYHIHDTGTSEDIFDTNIRYDHVFLKGDHGEQILNDITCEIPTGGITAVIGVSGSGKSSMTGLLIRFIDKPDAGEILLGGKNITEYKLAALRRNIAYVPQEPILPDETIYNIIAFGKEGVTDEEVQNAAKLAGAEEFILAHPNGYNYKVGDQGNLLSGGQRQRLMFARAYVKNARVMILDEVFASVDPKTRKEMLKSLRKYAVERTVILVTNQLDILEDEDRIIVMGKGKIAHKGKFRDLKKEKYLHTLLDSNHTEGGD